MAPVSIAEESDITVHSMCVFVMVQFVKDMSVAARAELEKASEMCLRHISLLQGRLLTCRATPIQARTARAVRAWRESTTRDSGTAPVQAHVIQARLLIQACAIQAPIGARAMAVSALQPSLTITANSDSLAILPPATPVKFSTIQVRVFPC